MRAFQSHIRQNLNILTSLSSLLLFAFAVLLIIDSNSRISTEELRGQLASINGLISATHEFTKTKSIDALKILHKSLESARQTLPAGNISAELEELLQQLQQQPDENKKSRAISLLGDMARGLSTRYYHTQRVHNMVLFSFGAALIILIITVLGFSFRINSEYSRYVTRTGALLRSIQGLLNMEKEIISFTPRWTEEQELLDAAVAIGEAYQSNIEISEHPVYGTLEAFVPKMQKLLRDSIPCDRVAVAFMDNSDHIIAESASSTYSRTFLEPGFISSLEQTTLGAIISSGKSRIINDLPAHYSNVHQSRATQLILQEGINASLTIPIEIRGNTLGFLFVSSIKKNIYTADHLRHVEKVLSLLKHNLFYHYIIQQIVGETTSAFVSLMERKDNETSLHIIRMSGYSYVIARQMAKMDPAITPMLLREIHWFSPLHDIGKIGIPDAILQKNSGLDRNERQIIEEHVNIGLDVIRNMNSGINRILELRLLNTAENIITSHHEKFDGTGYPNGLSGTDIPIEGRIVAIADVFDALTSKRPYKEAFSIKKAIEIISSEIGTHFDPDVYAAFTEALPEIKKIYNRYKEV